MFRGITRFFKRLFGNKSKPPPTKTKVVSAKNRNVSATGTFEHVTLYDLLVTLIHGNKSGKLRIRIEQEQAVLLVVKGKLVNAMFKGLMGEDAVMAIFSAVDESDDTEFFAETLGHDAVPSSISFIETSMDQLLLKIANQLDHQRQIALGQQA